MQILQLRQTTLTCDIEIVLGKLIFLFIAVPLADLFLLMVLSSYTGWPFSIGMVVLSGIVGAYLARLSYQSVWNKMRERMVSNQMSADLLTDGAMIFFAAGLLLTPGFITDAVGLSLLIPACRRRYKAWIVRWMKRNFEVQIVSAQQGGMEDIVDGEVLKSDASQDVGLVVETGDEP